MVRKKAHAEDTTIEPGEAHEGTFAEGITPNAPQVPRDPARGWAHDNQAGVQLIAYSDKEKKIYEMQIKFRDGKPSTEVRSFLKSHGFEWHADAPESGVFPGEGAWTRKTGYTSGAEDRIVAERTYRGVVEMIRAEKGLEPSSMSISA